MPQTFLVLIITGTLILKQGEAFAHHERFCTVVVILGAGFRLPLDGKSAFCGPGRSNAGAVAVPKCIQPAAAL